MNSPHAVRPCRLAIVWRVGQDVRVSDQRYRPLVAVHVIWHPAFPGGDQLGEALFRILFEDHTDLTSHGLRIPVRLWTGHGDGFRSRTSCAILHRG